MPRLPQLLPPASGPLFQRSGEVDLEIRLRKDDGSGVTALRHHPGPLPKGPLLSDQLLPQAGDRGDLGSDLRNFRPTNRPGHVGSVEENFGGPPSTHPKADAGPPGQPGQGRRVGQRNLQADRLQGHGPIHGAGVQIKVAQPPGQPPRGGRLAAAGGTVDRDNEALHLSQTLAPALGGAQVSVEPGSILHRQQIPKLPHPDQELIQRVGQDLAVHRADLPSQGQVG